MSGHWSKSALPYFVIVQDKAEVNEQTFANARRSSLLSQNNIEAGSSSYGNVLSSSKNYYPEIRYVFQDDPDYYDLEHDTSKDEEAIILEMDSKGENIVNHESITPDLQIMDISIDDRNLTKRITINTTRAELEGFDTLNPDKDLNYIKKLADLYRLRAQQLESIL